MKKLIKTLISLLLISQAYGYEIKVGLMEHKIDGRYKYKFEKGKNIIIEMGFNEKNLFNMFYPHVGVSINNKGYTSSFFTGITWHYNLTDIFFVEATFGGALNNAKKHIIKNKLGSHILFRESLSIGIKTKNNHSISVIIDHMSNANIASRNMGLTDAGIRYGFRL